MLPTEYLKNIDTVLLLEKYIDTKLQLRLGVIKAKCKREQIPFDITYTDLKPYPFTCPVFGTTLDWLKEGCGPSDDSPSLDRIIPELGYVVGNVRIISQRANRGKSNLSVDEILKLAKYIQDSLT